MNGIWGASSLCGLTYAHWPRPRCWSPAAVIPSARRVMRARREARGMAAPPAIRAELARMAARCPTAWVAPRTAAGTRKAAQAEADKREPADAHRAARAGTTPGGALTAVPVACDPGAVVRARAVGAPAAEKAAHRAAPPARAVKALADMQRAVPAAGRRARRATIAPRTKSADSRCKLVARRRALASRIPWRSATRTHPAVRATAP
jgi:hypothetical protein